MKNYFHLLAVLAAFFCMFSCTKEVPAELNVSTTELTFTKDGGSQSISFTTNKDWTASSSASWVKVTSSGSSSATSINVTADANTDYDDRTATITIKAENLTITVNIKQSTNLGLIVSKKDFDLTNEAQSIEIEIQANVEFDAVIDEACKDWIAKAETKGLTSNKIVFNISKNESYDNREGKIVVKQKNGSLYETVTVKQGQTNGLFLTTSEYAVSNSEHDITVEVKANVEFAVNSEADWITYVETKGLKTSNISLKVAKNETYDKRVGTVKVKQTNGSLEGIITITQDENLGLFVSPEEVSISKDAQEVEVEVQANVEYDIIVPEEAKGMITSVKTEGGETKALFGKKVRFGISENSNYEGREASVTFKQKNGELCGTVKISQKESPINIPDANFKAYCISHFDLDGDGEISLKEASQIDSLDIPSMGISSLVGVEMFPNLFYLGCSDNPIDSLNLSGCKSLITLSSFRNGMKYLNVSNCESLTNLWCGENNLTTLDASGLKSLYILGCLINNLHSVDVSGCSSLQLIFGSGNKQLSSFIREGCYSLQYVDFMNCNFSEIDLSNCESLGSIILMNNPLLSANFSGCKKYNGVSNLPESVKQLNLSGCSSIKRFEWWRRGLEILDVSQCDSLTYIDVRENKLEKLNIIGCSSLDTLRCHNNNFSSLEIDNPSLKYLDCYNSGLSNLKLTNCQSLEDLICYGNNIGAADFTKATSLKILECSNCNLASLDLNECKEIESIICYQNPIIELSINKCEKLKFLSCFDTDIESLNVEKCDSLKSVYVGYTPLKALDLSNKEKLYDVSFSFSDLTSLNLSGCKNLFQVYGECSKLETLNLDNLTELVHLTVTQNELSSISVSGCSKLKHFQCGANNKLATIDVSSCNSLESLNCSGCNLSSLDVSNNTSLTWLNCLYNQDLTELWLKTGQSINDILKDSHTQIKYK